MRLRIALGSMVASLLFLAGSAEAFELRLVPWYPTDPLAPYLLLDVYLDSQGEAGITSFSVSLRYETSVLLYRPDLSSVEDYYPLYAPAIAGGKSIPGSPATWLVPTSDPPRFSESTVDPGLDGQVNVEFMVNTGPTGSANGTATNLYLATLAFSPRVSNTYVSLEWGLGGEGNHFLIDGGTATASPTFVFVGDVPFMTPEPGRAVLWAAGLVGLGVIGRLRRA